MGFCSSVRKVANKPPVDGYGVEWPVRDGPAKSPSTKREVGKLLVVHVWTNEQMVSPNDIEPHTYARWMGRGPTGSTFDFYGPEDGDGLGKGKPFAGVILNADVAAFGALRPGFYWAEDYLRLFYDPDQFKTQVHEGPGHGARGWWHRGNSTVMNGDLRNRLGADRPEDVKYLIETFRDRWDVVEVRQGTPFKVLIDQLAGLDFQPGDCDGPEWGPGWTPEVPF